MHGLSVFGFYSEFTCDVLNEKFFFSDTFQEKKFHHLPSTSVCHKIWDFKF